MGDHYKVCSAETCGYTVFSAPAGSTATSVFVTQLFQSHPRVRGRAWSSMRFPAVCLHPLNAASSFFDIPVGNNDIPHWYDSIPGGRALPKLHGIADVVHRRSPLSYLPCSHVYFHAEQTHSGTGTRSFPLCWHTRADTRHCPWSIRLCLARR